MYVTNSGLDWEGKPEDFQDEFVTMRVTQEFGNTVDWNIVAGRDFSREFATDSMAFVINEAAAEYMGFEDPIGQRINWGDDEIYTVVGVAQNMVTQSPYIPVKQAIFFIDEDRSHNSLIKLKSGANTSAALAAVEAFIPNLTPSILLIMNSLTNSMPRSLQKKTAWGS